MALGRFKDLCVDAVEVEGMTAFWGEALGLTPSADRQGLLLADEPEKTIWVNEVSEPPTVKQRVHLDVNVKAIEDLEKFGATVLSPISEHQHWAVLADPEGGEFCGFVRDNLASYRLMELVVDSADPEAQARWWAGVVGGDVEHDPKHPWYWLENVPSLPFPYWVFVPVPEPKTVKNRVHWDLWADRLAPLLQAGATLLRPKDDEIGWHVCADPEGNEFCVFLPPAEGD